MSSYLPPRVIVPIFNPENYESDFAGITQTQADDRYVQLIKASQTLVGNLSISGTLTTGSWVRTANGAVGAPAYSFTAFPNTGIYHTGSALVLAVNGALRLLMDNSNTVLASSLRNADGTEANPGYSFNSDPDTGMYRIGANNLGFSTGATKRLDINSTDIQTTLPVRGPDGTQTAPTYSFTTSTNTGIYSSGSDSIAISAGGSNQLDISTTLISTPRSMEVGRGGSTLFFRAPIGTVSSPGISFWAATSTGLSFGGSNLNLVHTSGVRIALNNSNAVFSVRQQNLDGTDLLPSISFTLDPDTGIYRIGDNNIGISTGGTKRLDINSADIEASLPLIVPDGSATNPGLGFATAKNYGLFYSGTVISMAFNGAQRFTFDQNRLRGPNGTTAAPSFSFTGDTDTGMFWNGANILGFSTGGSNRMNISGSGVQIDPVNGTAIPFMKRLAPSATITAGNNATGTESFTISPTLANTDYEVFVSFESTVANNYGSITNKSTSGFDVVWATGSGGGSRDFTIHCLVVGY
jgi:hypothetical protein